jgi:hypothetical protein
LRQWACCLCCLRLWHWWCWARRLQVGLTCCEMCMDDELGAICGGSLLASSYSRLACSHWMLYEGRCWYVCDIKG